LQSLDHDPPPRRGEATRIYRIEPRPFDRAVEWALREWESQEPLAAR
jgi:hypothetical protein